MADNVSSLWLSRSMLGGFECAGWYSISTVWARAPSLVASRHFSVTRNNHIKLLGSFFLLCFFALQQISTLWFLSEPIFPLPRCEEDSTAQDSKDPLACLVLNCLVLSLLLWRNSPPPACPLTPPPPLLVALIRMVEDLRQRLLLPLKRTEKTALTTATTPSPFPPTLSFSFSQSIPPPYNSSVRNVLWVQTKCPCVNLCLFECVLHVQHTQNQSNPQWTSL